MVKITGLDSLQRQFKDAQKAFGALDGQFATVSFDPDNPTSVAEAIRTMERAIDAKVAPYRSNPLVANIVPQLKEKYRAAIRERARAAKAS
jgi:hypothetical protein